MAAAATPPPAPKRRLGFVEFCERLLELKLTPAQRVMSLVVFDGVEPEDLETETERKIADVMFGGVKRFPAELRAMMQITVFRLGRGSGKTMVVCAARAIYRMCTADLSMCGPGDIPAATIIAPRAEQSKIALNAARAFILLPKIRSMVVSSSSTGFVLRRPQDGREVQCIIVAKSHGGAAMRGYSLIEVFLDEAEFVSSGGVDAKVSDTDLVDAAMPRLIEGGRLNLVSTPWPALSECARLFEENFGHPSTAIAVMASTPMMRDNDPAILRKIEAEMKRKPSAAKREYFCILVDGAAGTFFEGSTIVRASVASAPTTKTCTSAAIDPAFIHDSFAEAIVERRGVGRDAYLDLVHLGLVTPELGSPLVPSEVVREFAATVRAHGAIAFATDTHKIGLVRMLAAEVGVQVAQGPLFAETAVYMREVLREGRLRGLVDHRLQTQMRAVTFRAKPGGGIAVESPRSREEGHGDLVAAVAMAVWFDRQQYGPIVRGIAGQ